MRRLTLRKRNRKRSRVWSRLALDGTTGVCWGNTNTRGRTLKVRAGSAPRQNSSSPYVPNAKSSSWGTTKFVGHELS